MTDTEAAPAPAKVAKVKKTPKPKKPASHPPYQQMITEAITSLKEKKGSSRQAIMKYIMKTHKISAEDISGAHMKLALKRAVVSGVLKQSKGTGASGSFKLGEANKSEKKPAKKTVKKAKSPKKATKAVKKSPKKIKAKKPKTAKPKTKKATKSPKKPAKKAVAKKPAKAKKPKPAAKKAKK